MKRKNIEKIVRKMYDLDYIGCKSDVDLQSIIDNLAEEFPEKQPESNNEDDEMEEFKWENCIKGKGYYVNESGNILDISNVSNHECCQAIANSESLIESNIAACKLSWIITKINKKYPDVTSDSTYNTYGIALMWYGTEPIGNVKFLSSLPRLNNIEVFETLVKTNLPLIKQYFGIKE